MRTTPRSVLGRQGLLFSLLLFLATAVPVAAQTDTTCRCTDANGNPIENCRCFRMPTIREPLLGMFGAARARIGVSLEENANGAAITEVLDASPAQAAGLVAGDVITRLDGRSLLEPLTDATRERRINENGEVAVQRLMAMAQDWEVGTAVDVEYLRNGERRTVSVSPEENPNRFGFATDGSGQVRIFGRDGGRTLELFGPDGRNQVLIDSLGNFFGRDGRARIRFDSLGSVFGPGGAFRPYLDSLSNFTFNSDGMRFMTACRIRGSNAGNTMAFFGTDCVDGLRLVQLGAELGDYFGTSSGVLVTEVADGTSTGLQPGDVILSIDGRAVTTPDQVGRILSSYSNNEDIRFRIRRRNQETEITGTRR